MNTEKLNGAEMTAVVLLLVGGLNWLLVGLFDLNLVTALFGEGSVLARLVFVIVGVATVYVMSFGYKLRRIKSSHRESPSMP